MNRPPRDSLAAIADWDVPRAAAAVLTPDGVVTVHGDAGQPFALASVSKVVAAVVTMIAVEEGTVALDDPAGPAGSTVRHLLAHASGLAPEADAAPLAEPGTRRIYSNHGFDTLAEHVAQRAGMPFTDYATAALVDTLGLTATTLSGSPAHAYHSCVDDLARLLLAVVSDELLAPETRVEMTTPAFPDLAGVLPGYGRQTPNPWGLGVEIRGTKSPHWTSADNSPRTWGHFGRAGTFVWFDPDDQLGLVVLTDRDFGPWAIDAWPTLAAAVLQEYM